MGALSPTNPPCVFKAYCNFSASGVLTIQRTNGGNTVTEYVNSGNALLANVPYTFYIHVDSGETIDFQYSVTCTINKFSVVEYDLPSSNQTDTLATTLVEDFIGLFKQNQNIGSIVSPVTSRVKTFAGYQESAMYLNYANGSNFLSGSSSDSGNNEEIASFITNGTINVLSITVGGAYNHQTTVLFRFQTPNKQYIDFYLHDFSIGDTNGSNSSSDPNVSPQDTSTILSPNTWYWLAVTQNNSTTLRCAIYSDSSGSVGTLVKDYGTFTVNLQYIQLTTSGGSANVAYTSTDYTSGFPTSISSPTYSNSAEVYISINLTENQAPVQVSLTYEISMVESTVFSGQAVIKFGIYPNSNYNFNVTSISINVEGLSAGTILSGSIADQNNIGGTANVDSFIVLTGNVNGGNPITVNSGDTLKVILTFTLTPTGTTGFNIFFDNLNGVSYVVLPLQ